MSHPRQNLEWLLRWEQRNQAIREVFGATDPPGEVVSFSWPNFILPGACSMCFPPSGSRHYYVYMTLGLSQPVDALSPAAPFEFCIYVRERAEWAHELLYDMTTQWLVVDRVMQRGSQLPVVFFRDPSGAAHAGLSTDTNVLDVVGSIRAMFLWDDQADLRFTLQTGAFRLLVPVLVTADEDGLALEATPPHLLLFLAKMGVSQIADPHRHSALARSGASACWRSILSMAHNEVVELLARSWPPL